MELIHVEMLPGVIVDANDPINAGRVKAVVPTLFDTASMSKESLPWIYPLTMWGYQSFSKMLSGSKIWCINNKDNEYEYWYIPLFEMIGNTQDNASKMDADIVISRKENSGDAILMYSNDDGFTMSLGETKITINPSNEIFIGNENSSYVKVADGKVYCGTDDDWHQAVMGDKLVTLISNLSKNLSECGNLCKGPLQPLQPGFMAAVNSLNSDGNPDTILAKNAMVN